MAETVRTLESKLAWPRSLTEYLQTELHAHFDVAWVTGYEPLIAKMTNQGKDRHVLAAAVHASAPVIVTFNLRHFGPEHASQWGVTAVHPESFLTDLFAQDPDLVQTKLEAQASDRGRRVTQLLSTLGATVPDFVALASSRFQT